MRSSRSSTRSARTRACSGSTSLAGLEWMPPIQRRARDLDAAAVLQATRRRWRTSRNSSSARRPWPSAKNLRSGEKALKTLQEQPFTKGGPERKELHAMFELLCRTGQGPEPAGARPVARPRHRDLQRRQGEGRQEGGEARPWQTAVAQLMASMTRRALPDRRGAEVLRGVGFGARELLDLNFAVEELKAGGFEARS